MYAAIPDVQIGTYPDLWRKGRYRVDLSVELPFDPDAVDAALWQMDYHMVDAGQGGQSYSHNRDGSRTAELDETGELAEYVKLVLRNGDLDEAGINAAEDYLNALYDRICESCRSRCKEYDYESPIAPIYPDREQEAVLTWGQAGEGI